MTDILASIGLVEIERYELDTLVKYRQIFDHYSERLAEYKWAELPVYEQREKKSSYHIYLLRIHGIDEEQRDQIIQKIFDRGVSVNVHFIPLPMLSQYKKLGYSAENYPIAYDNYSREITLPAFYDLTTEQMDAILDAVIQSVQDVLHV